METQTLNRILFLLRRTIGRSRMVRRAYRSTLAIGTELLERFRRFWHLIQRPYFFVNRRALPSPGYFVQFVRSSAPVTRPVVNIGSDVGVKAHPNGDRDFSCYDHENFFGGELRYETYDYFHKRVRKEDMGSAALYAFGVRSFREAMKVFPESTFQEQVQAVRTSGSRNPRYVSDIGCGLGVLSALLLECGCKVDAVDPSPVAAKMVPETVSSFTGRQIVELKDRFRFRKTWLMPYMEELKAQSEFPDTFIFVESIEHIPRDEMMSAVSVMKEQGQCLLIITSAVDYHPIYPDGTGWNHITLVDDDYYDALAGMAQETIVRAGSHLVLEL